MSTKITADHLSRCALVYVRQSTQSQVVGNRESQKLQYGLAERARHLGFEQVEVIDDDLGRSGSGLAARPGFDRLVGIVCGGGAGAVFCIEASRLARNGRDWHHLIDFCSLVGTVIVDPDGVYDPRLPNDRLLLGLKGTMSEFELTLFRQRSFQAKQAKAKRGELQFRLPVGLQWADGRIEMNPDRRVQHAIHSIFKRFERVGSIRQVLLTMRAEKQRVPAIVEGEKSARVEWKLPVYNTIHKVLTNPFYAGAYTYGKTEGRTTVVNQRARKTFGHRKAVAAWTVLIQHHHPGYITWEQFLHNQTIVASNAHMKQRMGPKAGRGGRALLAGLVRCARCGRMLHVGYGGKRQPGARYECRGANINHGQGGVRCMGFGALRVDEAIACKLLDAVSPKAVSDAVELACQKNNEGDEVHRVAALELEQARYEVRLASRRYESVDPENRLVATELEARWNAALAHVRDIERRLDELAGSRTSDMAIDRDTLLGLAESLPYVWNSSAADTRTKQRIVRTLVREVVADVDEGCSEIVLVIHWSGGRHTEIRVPKKRTGQHERKASVEVEDIVRRMSGRWSCEEIAATLNRMGAHTGTGLTWNEARVASLSRRMKLAPHLSEVAPRKTLTLNDAVERLGVSNSVIIKLIRRGLIAAVQVAPQAPYEIEPEALESSSVLEAVTRTRQRGRAAREWARDRRTLNLPGIDTEHRHDGKPEKT